MTVVDLFSGAGGLSLGLVQSGLQPILAVDSWSAAIKTYTQNIDDHAVEEYVSRNLILPKSDIIVGGPPCQGFSSAGLRRVGDKRNTLVTVFSELIADAMPKAFVFENVEGFLTGENSEYVFDLLTPLIEAGYYIRLKKVNAANFGIPQHRKRVIAIGGLGFDPGFPEITHRAFGAPGATILGKNLPPTPGVLDAIGDLPVSAKEVSSSPIQGHFSTALDEDDLKRVSALKEGQTMKDLPESLWHDTFKKRAHRRVMDGTPTERRGGAPAGIRRLNGGEPSKTITGGARSEFIHPSENRYLTLRECARIQTFPDNFIFCGTLAEQGQQIGNAVPPRLGFLIGSHLKKIVQENHKGIGTQTKGRLLEFTPTESNGMSPALKNLVHQIHVRFSYSKTSPNGGQISI